MDDKRINLLEKESVGKAVTQMAIPAIVGLLVMAIYNVVDTMFVAWIGTEATGATQVALPIIIVSSAIGLMFGIGGGSYVSRLLGQKDYVKAEKVLSTAFFTGLIIGLLYTTVSLIFMEPILRFFGADDSIMDLAKSYGRWIIGGASFMVLNMVMNNMLRSEGSANYSMVGMVVGSVLNIILDPIFIFVFDWGVAGAAAATILSNSVTTTILLATYLRHKTIVKLSFKRFRPKWYIYKEILTVGLPTFFKQLFMSISIALLNQNAVAIGGADLLAALGIIIRIVTLANNVVFGLGQGFQPVAGYNFGAKNIKRVKEAFRFSLIVNMGFTLIAMLIFIIFGNQIFAMFRATDSVVEYGLMGLNFYALSIVMLGLSNTITVLYQALGKGKEAMFLSVSRQGLFFIPLILTLPGIMGVQGVLISQLIADVLTVMVGTAMIIPFIKGNHLEALVEEA